MALDLRPVQVRLPDEAYEALEKICMAEDKDLGEKLREIAVRALLGELHALNLLAERLTRAKISGSER